MTNLVARGLTLIFTALALSLFGATSVSPSSPLSKSRDRLRHQSSVSVSRRELKDVARAARLRTSTVTRNLPGSDYDLDFDHYDSAEAAFFAGILFAIALVCLLICCCCGGCSLWDLVALVCLWELCCDRGGPLPGDFVLV
jgi:hypothetical protein